MDGDFSPNATTVNIDYMSTSKSFSSQDWYDEAYFADLYVPLPDQALDTFEDSDRGCSVLPTEFPASPDYPPVLQSTSLSAQLELKFAPSVDTAFILDPNVLIAPITTNPLAHSSLDKDALATPPLSPSSLDFEIPEILTSPSDERTPKRRRGRPRLKSKLAESIKILSPKLLQNTSRVSHNQVERKYRDGLNSELEKLRRVVPTLSQIGNGSAIGQPKPTKAMVLSCAIEYIKKIKREKEELRVEIKQLSGQTRI